MAPMMALESSAALGGWRRSWLGLGLGLGLVLGVGLGLGLGLGPSVPHLCVHLPT